MIITHSIADRKITQTTTFDFSQGTYTNCVPVGKKLLFYPDASILTDADFVTPANWTVNNPNGVVSSGLSSHVTADSLDLTTNAAAGALSELHITTNASLPLTVIPDTKYIAIVYVKSPVAATITGVRVVDTLLPPVNVATVTSTTGTLSIGSYLYYVTALNSLGETLGSASPVTTLAAVGGVTVTWDTVVNALSYNVYGRVETGPSGLLANVTSPTYTDDGSTAVSTSSLLPTVNSSVHVYAQSSKTTLAIGTFTPVILEFIVPSAVTTVEIQLPAPLDASGHVVVGVTSYNGLAVSTETSATWVSSTVDSTQVAQPMTASYIWDWSGVIKPSIYYSYDDGASWLQSSTSSPTNIVSVTGMGGILQYKAVMPFYSSVISLVSQVVGTTDTPVTKSMTPMLNANDFWNTYAYAGQYLYDKEIHPYILGLKDSWNPVRPNLQALSHYAKGQMSDITEFTVDYDYVNTLLAQLGVAPEVASLLEGTDYIRLFLGISAFYEISGTKEVGDFLGYILNGVFTIKKMWTEDYITFFDAGNTSIGTPVWMGGTWYPTSHMTISYEASLGVSFELLQRFFNFFAPINWVPQEFIATITLRTTIYVGSVGTLNVTYL